MSGGLHGVGASVVNALSKSLSVTVYQDGKIYQQEYARGKYLYDLRVIGETDRTGTTIRFLPDVISDDNPDGIFERGVTFDFDVLKKRLREMAFLNKGIHITFTDERGETPVTEDFLYEGGLREFVKYLNHNKEVLFPEPIYTEGVKDGILVEVAMQYNDSYAENIYTFVNNIATPDGGTHLTGFTTALTSAINDYGRKYKLLRDNEPNLKAEDAKESLTAVVSVKMEDPQFESQTKSKLGSGQVRGVVNDLVKEELSTYLEENPSVGRTILDRCVSAQRAREAARKAREATAARRCWNRRPCRANWRTAPSATPASAKSSSSRATPQAAAPRKDATAIFRRFCPCVAKSSTSKKPGWTRRWATTKSRVC